MRNCTQTHYILQFLELSTLSQRLTARAQGFVYLIWKTAWILFLFSPQTSDTKAASGAKFPVCVGCGHTPSCEHRLPASASTTSCACKWINCLLTSPQNKPLLRHPGTCACAHPSHHPNKWKALCKHSSVLTLLLSGMMIRKGSEEKLFVWQRSKAKAGRARVGIYSIQLDNERMF